MDKKMDKRGKKHSKQPHFEILGTEELKTLKTTLKIDMDTISQEF